MKNKFNIGDIIKSNRSGKELYALVTGFYPSAILYKVIYLHDGIEGSLSFKYAHKFYVVVSERA